MNKLISCFRFFNKNHILYTRPWTYNIYKHYSNNLNELKENHLNLFLEYNFHKPTIEDILANGETWSQISLTDLKNTIEVLLSYKFHINDITDILKSLPEICSINKDTLINTLEGWLACQFNYTNLIDTLSSQPCLLQIDSDVILKRITTYLLICNNNRSRCLNLLKSCPDIMFDNFEEILNRYNYLNEKMEINPKELVNSSALCYDINFIKTRHMFLERSGLYEYKPRNDTLKILNNPTLNSILDTSDEMFAEKITRMKLLEYETFRDYYQQELNEEDEIDEK